jgi:hypothetical protein
MKNRGILTDDAKRLKSYADENEDLAKTSSTNSQLLEPRRGGLNQR